MKKLIIGLLIFVSIVSSVWGYDENYLFNAVESKNLSRVQNYLHANANQLFKQGNRHISAFQLAVDMKLYSIAETLIVDGNAEINADFGVEPPLFIAIRNNDQRMVELLMNHGADPNLEYNGKTAFIYTITNGGQSTSSHLFDLLVKYSKQRGFYIDWYWKDNDGRTFLHYAVTGGNFITGQGGVNSTVASILRNGSQLVKEQDKNGDTPLHWACKSNVSEGILRLLLNTPEATEALRMTNNDGFNPLALYIFTSVSQGFVNYETLLTLVNIPGFQYSSMNMPASYRMDNGLFELARLDNTTATDLLQVMRIICRKEEKLASFKDSTGVPMLCVAVDEEWDPDIVELLIDEYDGDWTKLRDGKNNAIDIMRKNRSEDLYQDIFDAYM